MAKRTDALIDELRELGGSTLLFGHGQCFRCLTARFLDLPIRNATNLSLEAGTVSIIADGRDGPTLVLWNRRIQHARSSWLTSRPRSLAASPSDPG